MNKKIIETDARVFITTDPHGDAEALNKLLEKIDFGSDDILVIAGDLIDRGKHSEELVYFVDEHPNVICIKGNHEKMALDYLFSGTPQSVHALAINGGDWLFDTENARDIGDKIAKYPDIVEIRKNGKVYGVIHAEPDTDDWNTIGTKNPIALIWGRSRLGEKDCTRIANVEEIYCGHTILDAPTYTGNVLHMDMGTILGNDLFHVEL